MSRTGEPEWGRWFAVALLAGVAVGVIVGCPFVVYWHLSTGHSAQTRSFVLELGIYAMAFSYLMTVAEVLMWAARRGKRKRPN